MAGFLRTTFPLTKSIASFNYCRVAVNHLFTKSALGIDGFVDKRQQVAVQFGPMKEKFVARMNQLINETTPEDDRPIFTEDLKNVIHLVGESNEEVELLKKMIEKFSSHNQGLRFTNFTFGPVIMRLLYTFNRSDVAVELLKNPTCQGLFDHLTCYLLCADLLFENGQYSDVLDLYQLTKERGLFDNFPRDLTALVAASCYKIGTKEVYEDLKEHVRGIQKAGTALSPRGICIFAALAMKQGEAESAFELLSSMRRMSRLSRNLKVIAQCKLGRVDDAVFTINSYLKDQDIRVKADDFSQEAVDTLKETVASTNDSGLQAQFDELLKKLEANGHITQRKIEEMLFDPLEKRPRNQFSSTQQGSFEGRSDGRGLVYGRPSYDRNQDFGSRQNQGFQRQGFQRQFQPRGGNYGSQGTYQQPYGRDRNFGAQGTYQQPYARNDRNDGGYGRRVQAGGGERFGIRDQQD